MHASAKENIGCSDPDRHPERVTDGSLAEKVGTTPLLRIARLFFPLMTTF
jgi:hypothetical protein